MSGRRWPAITIQTRITLLLCLVAALFVFGLTLTRQYEASREEMLLKSNIYEKNTLFDKILRLEGASLEVFAYDFSNMDATVQMIRSEAEQLFDTAGFETVLKSFHVTSVWLYDPDFRLRYATTGVGIEQYVSESARSAFFSKLLSQRYFRHFFVSTPEGLLEVRTAPIQPAADRERRTAPEGFLFAGRLWSDNYIEGLSQVAESHISLVSVERHALFEPSYSTQQAMVTFSRIMYGWDDEPLRLIVVQSQTPIVSELHSFSTNQLIMLVAFVMGTVLLLSVLLIVWVNIPLKRISVSLDNEDPYILEKLQRSTTEFGNLARLVLRFFRQKRDLTREVGERTRAEDALRAALAESQRSEAETAALLGASRTVLQFREFPPAARQILAAFRQLSGARSGCIARVASLEPPRATLLDHAEEFVLEGVCRAAVAEGVARMVNQPEPLEAPGMLPDTRTEPGNVLCAPLMMDGVAAAVLILVDKAGGFTDNDLRMATAFGEMCSLALLNSRALESLENSEKRFRSVVETANDAIVTADSRGRIVFWNRQAEVMFGYAQLEAVGRNVTMLLPEPHNAHLGEMLHRLEQGQMPEVQTKQLEIEGLRADGTQFPIELSQSLWRIREGLFFTAIIRDISMRRHLEQLVVVQDKMASLGRVAAGIAHEIRNPLTGINSYLYTLRKKAPRLAADQTAAEMLESIIDQVQSASDKVESVIRRVMDFAKPSLPRLQLLPINRPVEATLELAAVTLRKSGMEVDIDLARDLPDCRIDCNRMEQVFMNLIMNAVEAVAGQPGPQHLAVSSVLEGEEVVVTVADSGPGVAAAVRSRIFDPFFTTKSDGSGIGLSMCQRIVTDHGGSLEVGTSGWGGAAFSVRIPVPGSLRISAHKEQQ